MPAAYVLPATAVPPLARTRLGDSTQKHKSRHFLMARAVWSGRLEMATLLRRGDRELASSLRGDCRVEFDRRRSVRGSGALPRAGSLYGRQRRRRACVGPPNAFAGAAPG